MTGRLIEGRYQLRECIGRGGAGVVYLARDRVTSRPVVLKFLAESLTGNEAAVARFQREARRLASARHDNIVALLGHGRDGGRYFLVMEYVDGEQLDTFIKSQHGRLPLYEFVPIAAQILKAVGYAHAREVVLRDVKASNVMLCERKGRRLFVKLLDFGLAKSLRQDVTVTEDHVVGGTVGYLSPEVLKGAKPDLAADVYSLGVLFFEMLSGRMPFLGETPAAILYKTVHEVSPSLRDVVGDGVLPEGLVELVDACLDKDPTRRPPDANQLVEQLIDAVPVGLFRLPAADPGKSIGARVGNTGMFSLLDPPKPSPAETVTPPSETAAPELPLTAVDPSPDPGVSGKGRGWVRSAAVVAVGLAVAGTWYFARPTTDPPGSSRPDLAASSSVQASSVVPPDPPPAQEEAPATPHSAKPSVSPAPAISRADEPDPSEGAESVRPDARRRRVANRKTRRPDPPAPVREEEPAESEANVVAEPSPEPPAAKTPPADPLPEPSTSRPAEPLVTPTPRRGGGDDSLLRPASRGASSDELLPTRSR